MFGRSNCTHRIIQPQGFQHLQLPLRITYSTVKMEYLSILIGGKIAQYRRRGG
jgi:hypothetical protein